MEMGEREKPSMWNVFRNLDTPGQYLEKGK